MAGCVDVFAFILWADTTGTWETGMDRTGWVPVGNACIIPADWEEYWIFLWTF